MQFKEYLGRAEELKAMLNDQAVTATPAAGASAQKARGKPNGDGGGGGGDVCFPYSNFDPFHLFPLLSRPLPAVQTLILFLLSMSGGGDAICCPLLSCNRFEQ